MRVVAYLYKREKVCGVASHGSGVDSIGLSSLVPSACRAVVHHPPALTHQAQGLADLLD